MEVAFQESALLLLAGGTELQGGFPDFWCRCRRWKLGSALSFSMVRSDRGRLSALARQLHAAPAVSQEMQA